jgi:hypothetical protein
MAGILKAMVVPPLLHYSAAPLTQPIQSVEQETSHSIISPFAKPRGLWVSVGDDWKQWCQREEYALHQLACVSHVILRDDASILRLGTSDQLDAFTARYAVQSRDDWYAQEGGIAWSQVAEQYHGIVIAPYIHWRSITTLWYSGWDCASGCIWNSAAIASVTPIPAA